jgi:acyl-CoA thioesterase
MTADRPDSADAQTGASHQETAERVVAMLMERDAFSQWLGVSVVRVSPGTATLAMTVRPEMVNGFGTGHGGIVFAFADSALAFASNGHGRMAVAIDNQISYPAAVRVGDVLTAEATEESRSERLAYYRVGVTRADGATVALFRGTVYRTRHLHLTETA